MDLHSILHQIHKIDEVLESLKSRHPPHIFAGILTCAQITVKAKTAALLVASSGDPIKESIADLLLNEFTKDAVEMLGLVVFEGRDPTLRLTEKERARFTAIQQEVILVIEYIKGKR